MFETARRAVSQSLALLTVPFKVTLGKCSIAGKNYNLLAQMQLRIQNIAMQQ